VKWDRPQTFHMQVTEASFSHRAERCRVWVCQEVKACWILSHSVSYEGVSKSFRTGRLERELQMVQLSASRRSCIAILWVSLVSFAAVTLCVASQRVFIVVSIYFVMTQSGSFWIHPRRLWVYQQFKACWMLLHCFIGRDFTISNFSFPDVHSDS
jgi:hypothetical protein